MAAAAASDAGAAGLYKAQSESAAAEKQKSCGAGKKNRKGESDACFTENDRISQRQMERQIVLVLLCPAFWQLAAYGASDGLPGMAGYFRG